MKTLWYSGENMMNYLTASLKSSKIPNHSHPVPFIFVSYCLIVCFKHLRVFTRRKLNYNCQGPIWCPSRGPCAMAQWHIGQSEPGASLNKEAACLHQQRCRRLAKQPELASARKNVRFHCQVPFYLLINLRYREARLVPLYIMLVCEKKLDL